MSEFDIRLPSGALPVARMFNLHIFYKLRSSAAWFHDGVVLDENIGIDAVIHRKIRAVGWRCITIHIN